MENKNTMWVAVAIAFCAGLVLGFVLMRQRAIDTMEAFKLVAQRQVEEVKESASKQKSQLRLGRIYVLENGQLMLEEGNKAAVGETVTLGDGATLTISGLITKPDGSTTQLEEGQSVMEDGSLVDKEDEEDSVTEEEISL